jgi:hypothetical protein
MLAAVMAALSLSVIDLTMSNYKASQRLELRAQADAVMESEFEYILYQFSRLARVDWSQMETLLQAQINSIVPTETGSNTGAYGYYADEVGTASNFRSPFLSEHQSDWRVIRMVKAGNSVTGYNPSTNQFSDLAYLDVKLLVRYVGPNIAAQGLEVRAGRKMTRTSTSMFGYGIYYQGDLELNPASNLVVDGDMLVLGNIYMAAIKGSSNFDLEIRGFIRQPPSTYFNDRPIFTVSNKNTSDPDDTMRITAADAEWKNYFTGANPNFTIGEFDHRFWLYNPNAPQPRTATGTILTKLGNSNTDQATVDPDANLVRGISDAGLDYRLPIFRSGGNNYTEGKKLHLSTIEQIENVYDGWEPNRSQASKPTLFPTVNDVNRALITPPPGKTDEYPSSITSDSDLVADKRIYNNASHIIEVDATGSIEVKRRSADGSLSTVTSDFISAIIPNPVPIYDEREARQVSFTEIDVGALKSALEADGSGFNGVLYVNVKGNTVAGTTTIDSQTVPVMNTNPTGALRAVRLKNAATTPNVSVVNEDGDSVPAGFTVATNTGLYVQGDYNTTPIPQGSDTTRNPAALAADAITVLSPGWSDTNALNTNPEDLSLGSRQPKGPLGETNYTEMTINAGIITGNPPTAGGNFSGGVNNLVRYLEHWRGKKVTFNGSLARLFDSKRFSSAYINSAGNPGGSGETDVFTPPIRVFAYDTNFRENDPSGVQPMRRVDRGIYYSWP